MHRLQWKQVDDGFDAPGYRVRKLETRWRLEAPGPIAAIRAGAPHLISWHTTAREAMLRGDQLERAELRRAATVTDFSISVAAMVALVGFSNAIGTVAGFLAVAVSSYLMLRSAANGVGLLLNDAWGWTRSGRQRSSILERLVWWVASRRRAHAIATAVADTASVRPLDPVS